MSAFIHPPGTTEKLQHARKYLRVDAANVIPGKRGLEKFAAFERRSQNPHCGRRRIIGLSCFSSMLFHDTQPRIHVNHRLPHQPLASSTISPRCHLTGAHIYHYEVVANQFFSSVDFGRTPPPARATSKFEFVIRHSRRIFPRTPLPFQAD